MHDPDFLNFMTEGGDELMNSNPCPKCGESIYLDQAIEWVDEEKVICICPHCGEKVKMNKGDGSIFE